MRLFVKTVIWVLALALLAYGGFRTYWLVQERRALAEKDKKGTDIVGVAVQRIGTTTLVRTVPVTGEVEALAVVDVVPKVTGRLDQLRLPDGTLIEEAVVVHKGQPIAVIEHSALDAAVQTANAAVGVAKASYQRAEVNLTDRRREKTRWENLYKEGSATEQQRDQAVTAYDRAAAELELTRAQISQAEASLRQAQVNLDEATIEAPISGVVTEKWVDEGDMVGPGLRLARIEQIDTVKVVGGVSERHIGALAAGKTTARLTVDAYPDEQFDGVVSRVGPGVDRVTRTVEIEVRVSNIEHRLKPGMFARLDLVLERKENVTVVSDTALLRQGPEVYAYVVNGSAAHRTVLKLGLSQGVLHEVVDGLSPGDLVVVRGQHMLEDGTEVEIVEEEPQ